MQRLSRLFLSILLLAGLATIQACHKAEDAQSTDEKAAIKAAYDQYSEVFAKKDLNAIKAMYAPDAFIFDVAKPGEYHSPDELFKGDSLPPGPALAVISELGIAVEGSVAYTHYYDAETVTQADGTKDRLVYRITDVLRKRNGKWVVVMEHLSFPIDPKTGKADLSSKP
jgi:ketosteroid isomerase-like protein